MANILDVHGLGTALEFGIPGIGGSDVAVLSFEALGADQSVRLMPEASGAISEWVLGMDLYLPSQPGTWTGLLQTGTGDADVFLRDNGDGTAGIGISSVYSGSFAFDAWVRVVISVSVEGGGTVLRKYIDGVNVGTQMLGATDRWAIDPELGLRLFTDNDGETSRGYVSSIFFMSEPPEVAVLEATLAAAPTASAAGFFPVSPAEGAFEVGFAGETVDLRYGTASVALEGSDYQTPVAIGDSTIARASQLGISTPGGADIPVLNYAAFDADEGLLVTLPEGAADLTSFTMVWDLQLSQLGGFQALLQLGVENTTDTDFCIRGDGGIGISGNYSGSVTPGVWTRIALSLSDNGDGNSTLAKYIDGALVGTQTVPTARFTVDAGTGFLLMADEDGEVAPGYLAHFGMADRALSGAEIAALGGVDADGPFAVGDGLIQLGFDDYATTVEFGGAAAELIVPDTEPPVETGAGIRDMLVSLSTEAKTYDLTEIFGAGAQDFAVTNSNGEAVAAQIENGILTLTFTALGLSDLTVTATGADGAALSDDIRVRVAGEGAYTIAILPDTQDYTSSPGLNHVFTDMTQWLADNAEGLGLSFVAHVGDITQWAAASQFDLAWTAMNTLREAGIPFSVLPGNHDIGTGGSSDVRVTETYNDAFSVGYMSQDAAFGGVYDQEPERFDNNYMLWTAGDGSEWITLSLEFGPRDDVLRWADEVLTRFADRKAVVVTHSYNNFDSRHDPLGTVLEDEGAAYDYGLGASAEGANDGDTIWREVISSHANVVMTAGGHIFGDGAQTIVSYNDYGLPVYQFLVNYQNGVSTETTGAGDASQGGQGGNGAMRLVIVDPENDAIYTETYFTELDQYFTGYRDKAEYDRDGLTGTYAGHQEEFYDAGLGRIGMAEAHAGDDQLVRAAAGADTAQVTLSTAGSVDGEGDAITAWTWTDETGAVVATGAEAQVALGAGVHDLTLTVETAAGVISRDDQRIIVQTDDVWLAETFNDGDAAGWVTPGLEPVPFTTLGTDLGFALPSIAGVEQRALTLSFDSHWRPEGQQTGALRVSFDGGVTWAEILHLDSTTTNDDGAWRNESVSLDILVPATASGIQFAYAMTEAGNNWYWAIDNIQLADASGAVLFFEDFEGLVLREPVDEGTGAGSAVWTDTPPEGWAVETGAGMPQGTTEWQGWTFADANWWSAAAGDQARSEFTKASGTVAIADPDEWDDNNDGSQNGHDFDSTLTTPVIALGGDGSAAAAAGIVKIPALSGENAILVKPEMAGDIAEYTLVYDLHIGAGQGGWTALLQTDTTNGSDAELFVKAQGETGGIGISQAYDGAMAYDAWNRLAFTFAVEEGAQVLRKYVNGQLVGTQVVDGDITNGSRWTIDADTGFLIFSDNDGDTSESYAAAFAFAPRALSGAEIAALGGVDLDGPLTAEDGAVQLSFDGALDATDFGTAEVVEIDYSSTSATAPMFVKGSAAVRDGSDGSIAAPEGALYDQSNAQDNLVIWQGGAWSDMVFEATLRSMDNDTIGLAFRYDEASGDRYLLTLDNQTNTRALLRIENGVTTVLATETGGYRFNDAFDIRIAAVGGALTVSADGVALFGGPVTDAEPLGAGTVGLYSSGQKSSIFDDVVVRAPELTADAGRDVMLIDWNGDGFEFVTLDGQLSILPEGTGDAHWTGRGLSAEGLSTTVQAGAGRSDFTLHLDGQTDTVTVNVASGDRLIAADRFEDGAAQGWRIIDTTELGGAANWQVVDGALSELSGASSRELTWNGASNPDVWDRGWSPQGDGVFALHKGSYALWEGNTELSDYAIQTRIEAPTGAVGLMLNWQDEDNYYKIEIDARVGYTTLVKVVEGYETNLGRSTTTYTPGEAFDLKAQIVDGKIQAWIDGMEIFIDPVEVRDLQTGAAGVWSWGAAGARFDDIAIVDMGAAFQFELHGTAANDKLVGTDADEFIYGGGGRMDQLTGGLGIDTFVFGAETHDGIRGTTRISDFEVGTDHLDLGGAEIVKSRVTGTSLTLWVGEDQDQIVLTGVTSFDDLLLA